MNQSQNKSDQKKRTVVSSLSGGGVGFGDVCCRRCQGRGSVSRCVALCRVEGSQEKFRPEISIQSDDHCLPEDTFINS